MRTWGYLGRGRMNLTLSHRSDFSLFDEELLFQKNSSGELWANTCRCVDMGSVGLHNSSIYKRGPQQKEIWNHMWFMQTVPQSQPGLRTIVETTEPEHFPVNVLQSRQSLQEHQCYKNTRTALVLSIFSLCRHRTGSFISIHFGEGIKQFQGLKICLHSCSCGWPCCQFQGTSVFSQQYQRLAQLHINTCVNTSHSHSFLSPVCSRRFHVNRLSVFSVLLTSAFSSSFSFLIIRWKFSHFLLNNSAFFTAADRL